MSLSRVGVIGAGTMGRGIAQVAALGGYATVIHDVAPNLAEAGAAALRDALAKGASRGRWSEEEAEAAANRVETATEIDELSGCGLLIEAAPEDVELKRNLFVGLAEALGPDPVLATNTSSLRVSEIADGVPQPERVVGMHFFNPPALMRLVEVVAAERSSEEALRMLGDGVADVATIDRIVRLGGGFRMGPFELLDLIGLDVNLEIARSFFRQGGEPERWRPSPIQEDLVAAGRLGRKSGRGYYGYDEARDPDPDLGIDAPTLDPEQLAKIDPRAEQVLTRLLAQIANEAAFATEERIASPEDMETAMQLGFNWPLGPLGFTELIGPARAVEILERLEAEKGAAYRPAPRLRAEE